MCAHAAASGFICCAEHESVCWQVDAVGKAEIMLQEDVKDALQSESAIRGGNSPLVHPEVPISVFQKSELRLAGLLTASDIHHHVTVTIIVCSG